MRFHIPASIYSFQDIDIVKLIAPNLSIILGNYDNKGVEVY